MPGVSEFLKILSRTSPKRRSKNFLKNIVFGLLECPGVFQKSLKAWNQKDIPKNPSIPLAIDCVVFRRLFSSKKDQNSSISS